MRKYYLIALVLSILAFANMVQAARPAKYGTTVINDDQTKIVGDITMIPLRLSSEPMIILNSKQINDITSVNCTTAQDIISYNICYIGRWIHRVVNGKITMTALNQGSELHFSVEGTRSITANFFADPKAIYQPYIAYSVDGAAFTRAIVANTVTIATGLQPTRHTVKIVASGIYYNDDVWFAGRGLNFQGVTVDEGAVVEPLNSTKKRILFLGDSITAGLNVLGNDGTPATAGAELTFPHIASDILGADPWQVGFGGTGVVAEGTGHVPNAVKSFQWKMFGYPINEPVPDVIVVAQGTNDGLQSPAAYQASYQNYLNLIRATYPGKPIFCMRPFLGMQS
ncbi:GDSL-type esterase/lipase family protein, partial [Pelotomaculum isophthalicicum JI]